MDLTRSVPKRYSFIVDQAGRSYQKKFELDRNIRLVRAVMLTSSQPHLLFYRGSVRLEISGDEIFPEDYESKLLMSGINVPPNEKYYEFGNGVLAGNGEIKLLYKDVENILGPFEPYEVSLYLECERA
jgi:hypothetical protein